MQARTAPPTGRRPRPGAASPKTYIRLADDTSLPLALQDRLIREGDELTPDNPFDARTLAGSHLKWLADPVPTARILGELATPPSPSAPA